MVVLYAFLLAAIANLPPGGSVVVEVRESVARFGVPGIVLLVLTAVLIAIVSEPFQIGLVRLLEGYWGSIARPAGVYDVAVEIQRRRRRSIVLRRDDANGSGRISEASYYDEKLKRYPAEARLLPTALGNALRAGEYSAGERYALSTVLSWPRIYHVLPPSLRQEVSELHQQIDGGARLVLVLGIVGLSGPPVLLPHGWWNLIWVLALLLARVAYKGAIEAANLLGSTLHVAYDLKRFDLMKELHLPLSDRPEAELAANEHLTRFWRGRAKTPLPVGTTYAHPAEGDTTPET